MRGHTHTHTHTDYDEDDGAATLHHICILKFFYLLLLQWVSVEVLTAFLVGMHGFSVSASIILGSLETRVDVGKANVRPGVRSGDGMPLKL